MTKATMEEVTYRDGGRWTVRLRGDDGGILFEGDRDDAMKYAKANGIELVDAWTGEAIRDVSDRA